MKANIHTKLLVTVETFVNNAKSNLLVFAGVLMLITISYQVATRLIAPDREGFDPKTLVGAGLAALGITFYNTFIDLTLNTPMEILNDIIDAALLKTFNVSNIQNLFDTYSTTVTDDMTGIEVVLETSPIVQTLHLFFGIFAKISLIFVFTISYFNQAIFHIGGVFVFAFALILNNASLIGSWYFSLLAAKFTIPVAKIIVALVGVMPYNTLLESTGDNNEIIKAVAFFFCQLVGVFAVISSSQIASKLISASASPLGLREFSEGKGSLMSNLSPVQSVFFNGKK